MNILYEIIILPLESIIEYVFCFSVENFKSIGVEGALIIVSLVTNFLALPLYRIADKLQLAEREAQDRLSYRVERIKKGFKGNEQFMMLSEYYRQNGYHPLYAVRASLSILISIPFFIAAYHFLSGCTYLDGVKLWFIKDLGKPDTFYSISVFGKKIAVNILPIIMTLINLISSIIYTKGAKLREKAQTLILAFFFLGLLYNSPAGLVLYWISNNIFSLCKNVILTRGTYEKKERTYCYNTSQTLFLLSGISICILAGAVIPSNAIKTSVLDFALVGNVDNPVGFIIRNVLYFFGLFVFWPLVIYKLFNKKIKKVLESLWVILAFTFLANVFVFRHAYGNITETFSLQKPEYLKNTSLMLVVCPFVFSCLIYFAKKFADRHNKSSLITGILTAIIIAEVFVISFNIIFINREYRSFLEETGINPKNKIVLDEDDYNMELFHLSKTEPNVIVLFLDRAISNYFPYIMHQFPELKEVYSGFVYHPNCISFSDWTACAGPAMFGGYEYTIDAMDDRADMLLKDKLNEAERVMPKIFSDEGYKVSMVNMPFPNFNEGDNPLEYVYEGMENVNAFNMPYKFEKRYRAEHESDIKNDNADRLVSLKCRNFSAMQMMYPMFRDVLYKGSNYYYDVDNYTVFFDFMVEPYSQLYYLNEAFTYDGDSPTFTLIGNETTHDFPILREDYSLGVVNGTHKKAGTGERAQEEGPYHVNVASYLQIAKLIEKLKENGVYDNTRLVIIADHGYAVNVPAFEDFKNGTDMTSFNPLLIVKDFNANGEPTVDNTFVTNADLVNIVSKGLGVSDSNPYTNNKFKTASDFSSFNVYRMDNWWTENYQKDYKYPIKDKVAYNVKDNIFVESNWKPLDTTNVK